MTKPAANPSASRSAQPTAAPLPSAREPALGEPQIRIEIRSNPLYLAGVRELLGSLARRLGFSEEAGSQISLAVDEALCNVIRHGYGKAVDRPIWLSVWPEGGAWSKGPLPKNADAADAYPDALRIVIEDEARQVDPATIRSRDLDEVRPGGLGVHIIQSVMDEAVYERRGPVGMRLVMRKKRTGAAAAGAAPECCVRGSCPGGGV